MADKLTAEQRHRCMSMVKSKGSHPEMIIRKGLHNLGLRFRLHNRQLPGTPDLIFSKHKTVLFVHGCFWHKHNCDKFSMPSTRKEFWEEKLSKNKLRDTENVAQLRRMNWKVIIVWECAVVGKNRWNGEQLMQEIANIITVGERCFYEIMGS